MGFDNFVALIEVVAFSESPPRSSHKHHLWGTLIADAAVGASSRTCERYRVITKQPLLAEFAQPSGSTWLFLNRRQRPLIIFFATT